MDPVSSEDFLIISKMSPEQRFDYALEKMINQQALWGLFGEEGWVMLKADEDNCLPVWPHKEFAEAWVKDDFPNCEPKTIALNDWTDTWLPGMQKNQTLVLVFPLGEDEEGIMLEGEELLTYIQEDMQKLASQS